MSGSDSDDDKPESAEDTEPSAKPKVEVPKVEVPKVEGPKVEVPKVEVPKVEVSKTGDSAGDGSLFDEGWGSVLSDKSPAPMFAPPSTKPRTSEGHASVSGQFDKPEGERKSKAAPEPAKDAKDDEAEAKDDKAEAKDDKAEAKDDKAEAKDDKAEAKDDKAEAKDDKAEDDDEAEAKDDEDEEDDEDEDEHEHEHEHEDETENSKKLPRPVAADGGASQSNSSGMLLLLAVAAAIVLIVVFVNRSNAPGSNGSSKPNRSSAGEAGSDEPRPQPRSKVGTHAADPAAEALRNHQSETAEAGPATGPATGTDTGGAEEDTGAEDTGGTETGGEEPAPEPEVEAPTTAHKVDDPRHPSLIPPGTPEENAKAFIKLPVSIHDGAPIGGIGRSGIHVDEIAMSQGRDNADCQRPSRSFTTDGTEFINVCFRVIHPRASETLRVIWEKDGAVTRRGKVRIPENLHAYKTRAYLQVRAEYVGSWRVRVVPEGEEDTDLAVVEFEISQ